MIDIKKANEYIETQLGQPFAWGTNDCNTFIVDYFCTLTSLKNIMKQ